MIVTIETSAEGLDPGEVVTVEWNYDPDEVELILIPAAPPLTLRQVCAWLFGAPGAY